VRISIIRRAASLAAALGLLAAGRSSAAVVDITKLSDVAFTNLDPTLSASSSQSICVYSASTSGLYTITASGSGAGSAFALQAGGSIPDLPYSVLWSPSGGQTGGVALSAGAPLGNQTSGALSVVCALGIGTSASLTVSLASSDLLGATAGVTYSGQLTLTVTAQ